MKSVYNKKQGVIDVNKPIKIEEEPIHFDAFWRHAKDELRQIPYSLHVHKTYTTEAIDEVGEFSYLGAKKQRIFGFYLKHQTEPSPTVLMFHGYGWHKGYPEDYMHWYQLGVNVFSIDIRGQKGLTKDSFPYQIGDHRLMTRGLESPDNYYLKHVYQDGIQLIELVKTLPFVDPKQIILNGASQGGGIVFALAGLCDVSLTFSDVPSYSYFRGRIETKNGSVREIADFIHEKKMDLEKTLSNLAYFDLTHFASRIQSPLIASVGLEDDICPAKYFMPAYQEVKVMKRLYEYPNAGHEGGADVHHRIKLEILKKVLHKEEI